MKRTATAFCIRLRRTRTTGHRAGGIIYERDPVPEREEPPMFLALGFRRGPALMCDAGPENLWVTRTRAGATGAIHVASVRALCKSLGVFADVVTLRHALGWVKAACEVSSPGSRLTSGDARAIRSLRQRWLS